jgi:hypothetical protein
MAEDLSPGVEIQEVDAGRRQAVGWDPVAAGR